MQKPSTVRIEFVPVRARVSQQVRELIDKGCSLENAAKIIDIGWGDARAGLSLPERIVPPRRALGPRGRLPKYVQHAAEVTRLRDQDGISFPQIAKTLGIHLSTATRAYDHYHRGALEKAGALGQTTKRGRRKTLVW